MRRCGQQLAVGLDDVEKGLHPGFEAGIGRVAVELQGQGGLAAHDVAEIADEKRVRAAGKIGDVGAEQLGVLFDHPGGLHDELAHAPVHVPLGTLRFQVQEVERYDRNSARGELVRDAHVGLLGKAVVRPRQDNHSQFLRIGLRARPAPAGRPLSSRQSSRVGVPGRRQRLRALPAAPTPICRAASSNGSSALASPCREIDERRQQPCAASAQPLDSLPEGALQVEGLPLHQGADLGLAAGVVLQVRDGFEVGQKDELRRVGTFQQAVEKAVGQLDRVAKGCTALVDPLQRWVFRQDDLEAQGVEEMGIERVVGVDEKAAVESDPAPGRAHSTAAGRHAESFKHELPA